MMVVVRAVAPAMRLWRLGRRAALRKSTSSVRVWGNGVRIVVGLDDCRGFKVRISIKCT